MKGGHYGRDILKNRWCCLKNFRRSWPMHALAVSISHGFLSTILIPCGELWHLQTGIFNWTSIHLRRRPLKGKCDFLSILPEGNKMTPILQQTGFGKAEAGASDNPTVRHLGLLVSKIMPAPQAASGMELTLDGLKWNYCRAFSKSNQLWNKLGGKMI